MLTLGAPASRKKAIPEITKTREGIAKVDPTSYLTVAVGVWSPHTHWDNDHPFLVEEMHEKGYFLRALTELPKEEKLLGVSFAIKNGELLVYEYARESVFTEKMLQEYPDILAQLQAVARIVKDSEAGVTLLHRFKESFFSDNVSTAEHLATNEGSLITKEKDFPGSKTNLEAVIWNAFDFSIYLPLCFPAWLPIGQLCKLARMIFKERF